MTFPARLLAALAILAFANAGALAAGPPPDRNDAVPAAQAEVEAAARKAGVAGTKAEKWASEREALLDEARQLIYDTEATRFAVSRQLAYIATEKSAIEELSGRLETAQATRRDLDPVMEELYAELVRAQAADPPFAADERLARLAGLRRTLDDPDASAGDRLGRLLEALRIEAGYGLDVEAEDAVMDVNGAPMALTLLRVGRLALLRMPASGEWVERYDTGRKAWTALAAPDARELVKAVQIARRQRIAEMVTLPVGSAAQLAPNGGESQ